MAAKDDTMQPPSKKQKQGDTADNDTSPSPPAACPPETPSSAPPDNGTPNTHDAPDTGYEYLDHTADVQLHSWGTTLQHAFEQSALAMCNYMTPLADLGDAADEQREIQVKGQDLHTLLFNYLDEVLFLFHTEAFAATSIQITTLDTIDWTLEASAQGTLFNPAVHECGTEVKAITYSAMQVQETANRSDVYVIVDI